MRESQVTMIRTELASGKWVPSERFMDMYIPDYRSRICELKRRGSSIVSRRMQRTRSDGSHRYSNDWMDVEANAAVGQEVYRQVVQARASHQGGAHAHTSVQITLPGTSINVALGRVLYLSAGQMTAEIMAGWADSAL